MLDKCYYCGSRCTDSRGNCGACGAPIEDGRIFSKDYCYTDYETVNNSDFGIISLAAAYNMLGKSMNKASNAFSRLVEVCDNAG